MLLGPDELNASNRGCWIATLRSLRTKLSLTSVDFSGFLTNFEWFLDKNVPGNDCPLSVFEVTEGAVEPYDEEGNPYRKEGILAATDESWSMTCPMRDSDSSNDSSDPD